MARPLIELKRLSKCYNLGLPSEAEVLRGAGYSADEIAALRAVGVAGRT